ncbi:MAG: hypothetical protein AB4290_04135 [Spirulina sp.]
MKLNFETMKKAELRAYVLKHKGNEEALRALMSRRDPNGVKYKFPDTEEGREQIEAVIKCKIERDI